MDFSGTPRPVVHYQFGCQMGKAAVLDSGPLMATLQAPHHNSTLCHLSSNGVIGPLESVETVSSLRDPSNDAFAIQLWFTMIEDYSVSIPIVTFADAEHTRNDLCNGYQFALAQRGRWLEIRYLEDMNCRILVLRQKELIRGNLQQFLVSWSAGKIDIYLDGAFIVNGAPSHFDPTLSNWDSDMKLRLYEDEPKHATSLNMLSIYNQTMNTTQVAQLYQDGKALLVDAKLNREPLQFDMDEPNIQVVAQGQGTVFDFVEVDFDLGGAFVPEEWQTLLEVTSIPDYGTLMDASGDSLEVEDRFEVPLKLGYLPRPSFFNAPTKKYDGTSLNSKPESFSYRFITIDANKTEIASSKAVNQNIVVVHVNHPPVLKIPKHVTSPPEVPRGSGARPRTFLKGAAILDELDHDIDRVRVDVWTSYGTLTLSGLGAVDFSTCRSNQRPAGVSWACHGSGLANRNMTFVGTPSEVSLAIASIEYLAFGWDKEDEVVIRVYDGVGGHCLTDKEHRQHYPNCQYYTIHNNTCFEAVGHISIPALLPSVEDAAKASYLKKLFAVGEFGLANGIFWGIVILLLFCLCASIRSCIRCLGARGAKIHTGDDDQPEDDFNADELDDHHEVV